MRPDLPRRRNTRSAAPKSRWQAFPRRRDEPLLERVERPRAAEIGPSLVPNMLTYLDEMWSSCGASRGAEDATRCQLPYEGAAHGLSAKLPFGPRTLTVEPATVLSMQYASLDALFTETSLESAASYSRKSPALIPP